MKEDLPDAGRQGVEQLQDGNLVEAKKEFACLQIEAWVKKHRVLNTGLEKVYWRRVEELAEDAEQVLHDSRNADEALKQLEELFEGRVFEKSGIWYQGGVGEPEKTVDKSDTDEVMQDRIEFLEEEIKRSQEDLMEMKEELEDLRDN